MWIEPKEIKKTSELSIEEQILKIQDNLTEEQAQEWLYRFFKANPTFMMDMMGGVELYPFQHILMNGIMKNDYSMLVASRGIGKTWLAALAVIELALFNPGWKIGVMANSFRQSKGVLKKIEDIIKKPEATLLKACMGEIRKGNDEWTLPIGDSLAICLPLGSGEKLRGFRFNALIIDEFLLFPESVYTEIIIPFLAIPFEAKKRSSIEKIEKQLIASGSMKEEDRIHFENNKLIILSSASYKFDYLYKLYSQWFDSIINKVGNDTAKKFIAQLSCEVAPEGLYNKDLIEQGRQSMSDAAYRREFLAQFTEDSSGFFKISKIHACSYKPGTYPSIEVKGDPSAEYVLAFDPSWAENESSDDFAIHVFKIDNETHQGTMVHSYAMHGRPMRDHIAYFKYLLTNFNIVFVVGDYNGGLQFLNAANESAEWKNDNLNIGMINLDFNDKDKYLQELSEARKVYDKEKRVFCFLRTPNPAWIREANESLQNAFDRQKIWFAAKAQDTNGCSSFNEQSHKNIPIDGIIFNDEKSDPYSDKSEKMIDFIDWVYDNVELSKIECSLIQVSSTSQGTLQFNLPSELRRQQGDERTRKDSYSALVLGNYGINLYYDIIGYKEENPNWEPFFL